MKKEKRSALKLKWHQVGIKWHQPVEHEEEASKRKYEVIGTDIEMEYEEMDTEDEEHEVRRLTKEELEMYHQYKEFYTIQARTKGKMPGFGYIHRLKVKEYQLTW